MVIYIKPEATLLPLLKGHLYQRVVCTSVWERSKKEGGQSISTTFPPRRMLTAKFHCPLESDIQNLALCPAAGGVAPTEVGSGTARGGGADTRDTTRHHDYKWDTTSP